MRSRTVLFALLLPLLFFLSFNKHSKDEPGSYQSILWGDAAGYNVYLPLFFIYGGDAEDFPKRIEERTGDGFRVDREKGKLYTKYFLGSALLQAPFYLTAHVLSEPLGYKSDGYSWIYQASIMVAGVFYLWTGLLILYSFLKTYFFKKNESILLILIILFGSHLYYYAIDRPGMSHIYSFFLFGLFIYLIGKLFQAPKKWKALLLGLCTGLILLCRPSNAIFLSFPLFFTFSGKWDLKERIAHLLERKNLFPIAISACLLLLSTQLFYWEWATGSPFFYSYGQEGFDNWDAPKIFLVLFSTKNGLLPYTPLFILILTGMVKMGWDGNSNGWAFLLLFFLLTYIVASWWNWWFGCSFGARNYVEYLAPFSIPLGYLLFRTNSLLARILFYSLIVLFVYANLELFYYYKDCFKGGVWDWQAYWNLY